MEPSCHSGSGLAQLGFRPALAAAVSDSSSAAAVTASSPHTTLTSTSTSAEKALLVPLVTLMGFLQVDAGVGHHLLQAAEQLPTVGALPGAPQRGL